MSWAASSITPQARSPGRTSSGWHARSRGDQLLSINGLKDFYGKKPEEIRRNLASPATLVFVGFAGHPRGEVRIHQYGTASCGLPETTDVIQGDWGESATAISRSPGAMLQEMAVFRNTPQALFMRADPPSFSLQELTPTPLLTPQSAPITEHLDSGVYELQRTEAQRVVQSVVDGSPDLGIASEVLIF